MCDAVTTPTSTWQHCQHSPQRVDFIPSPATGRWQIAGFAKPILHGLCTYGVAGHALLKTVCGYDPARMKSLRARFSAPVYPGETIRTEIWREQGNRAAYRCSVLERGISVITGGLMELRD